MPAPYWAAVSPVLIPLASCNRAADLLINWFGPEELKHVVGGEKWWQVRGLDGVDSEWVTEKEYLGPPVQNPDRKLTTEEANILRMDHLDTVMVRALMYDITLRYSDFSMCDSFTFTEVNTTDGQSRPIC